METGIDVLMATEYKNIQVRLLFIFLGPLLILNLQGCVRYADYRALLHIEATIVGVDTQQELDDVKVDVAFLKGGDAEVKEDNGQGSVEIHPPNISRIYDLSWGRKEWAFMPLGSREDIVITFSRTGFSDCAVLLEVDKLPRKNNVLWANLGTIRLQPD